MDNKIHCLYAKGMTTRKIVATFIEMYDADVPASLISKVTDAILEQVVEPKKISWEWKILVSQSLVVFCSCKNYIYYFHVAQKILALPTWM